MSRKAPVILVVDDDPDYLDVTAMVLEAKGCTVLRAASPEEALGILEKETPDLVMTDLMMSRLDSGFSFAKQLRGDPRLAGTPVIIITGVHRRLGYDFSPRSAEELAAMKADAYFEKPVDPATLLAKVEELLRRRGEGGPA